MKAQFHDSTVAAGKPEPEFDQIAGCTVVTFRFTRALTPQVTGQVEPWMMDVLKHGESPLKSSGIQEIVGIQHRETFHRNCLDRMLKAGLMERTIPDKPNSPLQKYRLTEKGRALLS